MLRVYLDQNKWIDLARAATGHDHGGRFTAALAAARAASASGLASFPLDIYRHLEIGKRANERSRNDIADLIHELSKQHALARPHTLLPAEIDDALQRRFGRPEAPRSADIFGDGIRHITDGDVALPPFDRSKLPGGGTRLTALDLERIENAFADRLERELLGVGPNSLREAGFDPSTNELAKQYVEHENNISAAIREWKLSGDMLEFAVRASDLGDIRPAVAEALGRIGMTWEGFVETLGPSGLASFIDDLPTRYVTNVMRTAKLRQAEQKWEPNDFNDILALPVAAVYCDVVVTEKQWIHRLRQGKVDQRFSTILLSDTADLVDVLATVAPQFGERVPGPNGDQNHAIDATHDMK